jgi:maleate cis-trans isomerase
MDRKPFAALGEEQETGRFFYDANGKAWPIYSKRIDVGAMPNAATKNVAHNIAALKLDGHFKCTSLRSDNGVNVFDETIGLSTVVSATAANLVVITATDLSTHLRGMAVIEYCKTTD